MNCLMANSERAAYGKKVRDEHLTIIERVNYFFTTLMFIFSFAHCIAGLVFINNDILEKG